MFSEIDQKHRRRRDIKTFLAETGVNEKKIDEKLYGYCKESHDDKNCSSSSILVLVNEAKLFSNQGCAVHKWIPLVRSTQLRGQFQVCSGNHITTVYVLKGWKDWREVDNAILNSKEKVVLTYISTSPCSIVVRMCIVSVSIKTIMNGEVSYNSELEVSSNKNLPNGLSLQRRTYETSWQWMKQILSHQSIYQDGIIYYKLFRKPSRWKGSRLSKFIGTNWAKSSFSQWTICIQTCLGEM